VFLSGGGTNGPPEGTAGADGADGEVGADAFAAFCGRGVGHSLRWGWATQEPWAAKSVVWWWVRSCWGEVVNLGCPKFCRITEASKIPTAFRFRLSGWSIGIKAQPVHNSCPVFRLWFRLPQLPRGDGIMRGVQHLRELLLAQFQLQSALPYVLSKSRRRSRSNKLVDELDAIRCHPLFQGDMALNTKRTNTQQHPGACSAAQSYMP
jgi:hypothetical protein